MGVEPGPRLLLGSRSPARACAGWALTLTIYYKIYGEGGEIVVVDEREMKYFFGRPEPASIERLCAVFGGSSTMIEDAFTGPQRMEILGRRAALRRFASNLAPVGQGKKRTYWEIVEPALFSLAYNPKMHVKQMETVIHGKARMLYVASLALHTMLKAFRLQVEKAIEYPPFVFAYVKNRSILQCARYLFDGGNCYFLEFDLQNAFETPVNACATKKLHRLLKMIGCHESNDIHGATEIIAYNGVYPFGFTSSPMLFNLGMSQTDTLLSSLARHYQLVYARYSDNLFFSSATPIDINRVLGAVRRITSDQGWALNEKKIRYQILSPTKGITICGLVVKPAGEIAISQGDLRRYRQRLWFIYDTLVKDHPTNPVTHRLYLKAMGLDAYLRMVYRDSPLPIEVDRPLRAIWQLSTIPRM